MDCIGDPNLVPAYRQALSALYGLSYGVKFSAKAKLGKGHVVGTIARLHEQELPARGLSPLAIIMKPTSAIRGACHQRR